ncbi:superoxide dismutase [Rhizorhabdus dicambivorans]|uniref:Superoxide dismutase n=1 Tax=Rhizorhabdus dicambivorans TaxID=1850238 RepID=A0A2A4G0R5_9SPHN|nr:superoxide dismutase [Rhizorhabdus dicambivorans]ATE67088.1 superoxide dismutase [Rhizorhabdus dicambivorans]PCE43585.1 superoxide dismutase [Rhizorhabdus dicambivorans]
MAFVLPPLPFDKAALEPVLSAESFDYHHGKHHKAYVDKVNGWIEEKELAGKSLVEVIDLARDRADKPLLNNAGQIWNHDFFWQCLAPEGSTRPSERLTRLIEASFGSQQALVEKLAAEAVGHFGSGWAWLVLAGDALKIMSFHDGETPLGHEGLKPLLTLDVWEHAYYIDYRNARPKFAEAVLGKVVNWDFVSRNIDEDAAAKGDLVPEAA